MAVLKPSDQEISGCPHTFGHMVCKEKGKPFVRRVLYLYVWFECLFMKELMSILLHFASEPF